MKKPMVLAIVNLVTIGLGYVMLGKKPMLGWLLTIGAGGMLRYEELRGAPLISGSLTFHWIVMCAGLGILGLGTGIDVYRDAKALAATKSARAPALGVPAGA